MGATARCRGSLEPSPRAPGDGSLAGLVARREASPQELLDIALQQNVRAHPKINAVCRLMDKEARAHLARPLSGPFAGVPFLIKDNTQDYAGLPTSNGSRSMLSVVPREHAHVVRRYLAAGLVVFGKTNLPEFALKAVTDCALFGRTVSVMRRPRGADQAASA